MYGQAGGVCGELILAAFIGNNDEHYTYSRNFWQANLPY